MAKQIVENYLQHLRMHICRCCGLKARGRDAVGLDECSCIIEDIHDVCAKCPNHCACPGFVNADGYWEYEVSRG